MALLNSQFALRRHFDLYALEQAITPRVVVECNSLGLILQSVGQGRLVTVLPTTIALTQPRLTALPVAPELPHYTIALVSAKGGYRSPACQAFVEMAAAWKFSNKAQGDPGSVRPGKARERSSPDLAPPKAPARRS